MISRVLWDWNVHSYNIDDKLEAAEAGSFDVLTVPYRVYNPWIAEGGNPKKLLQRAADKGVRLDFLDGMTSWSSVRYPPDNDFARHALDFSIDDALRLCDALELRRIVAAGGFEFDTAPPLPQLVDEFGRFCTRAAASGLSVDLEFTAMMGIRRLDDACEIVKQSGARNAAVMFDTWHFCRGDTHINALRESPRGLIRNVQLVDGWSTPVGASIWDDTANRLFPGDGELPLNDLVRALRDTQDLDSLGPEAMPQNLTELSPHELGIRAAAATEDVLRATALPDSKSA